MIGGWVGRNGGEEDLEGKNGDEGKEVRYEAVEYPGAEHGFTVRRYKEDALQRERGERSENQAVEWFGSILIVDFFISCYFSTLPFEPRFRGTLVFHMIDCPGRGF